MKKVKNKKVLNKTKGNSRDKKDKEENKSNLTRKPNYFFYELPKR